MREVIGVKDNLTNQISYIFVNHQYHVGDFIIFDGGKGKFIFECVRSNEPFNKYVHAIIEGNVVKIATSEDLRTYSDNQLDCDEFEVTFNTMLRELNINAQLIGTTISLENNHIKYTYFSTSALKFPILIKYLLKNNHRRVKIEFYQVGEREYYAINGGIGVCGYELCCHSRSHNTPTITTNTLKTLGINTNVKANLGGTCSKYKCCLLFEHSKLEDYKLNLPDLDTTFIDKEIEYVVVDIKFDEQKIIALGKEIVEFDFDFFVKGNYDSNE